MELKIRTIYFKARNLSALRSFYAQLFDIEPKQEKNSDEWVEFDFGNINLSLLPLGDESWQGPNCVPVFEFRTDEIDRLKQKAIDLGGKVLDVAYDEFNSVSCVDVEGNEFEITDFHD
jgi:predicted enzyme related to lactoylglutathione lyase